MRQMNKESNKVNDQHNPLYRREKKYYIYVYIYNIFLKCTYINNRCFGMKTTMRLNVVNHHFYLHSAQSTYILC